MEIRDHQDYRILLIRLKEELIDLEDKISDMKNTLDNWIELSMDMEDKQ